MINVDNIQELMELYKKLYSQLEPVKRGDEFDEIEDNIVQDLRKLTIAQIIQKKYTICITGLQGSGKTTLMQHFYDLPNDALTVSLGRGEKIPVFITEKKDISSIKYYVTELQEREDKTGFFEVVETEIDREDFKNKSTELTESSHVMYLEVCVPFKYTKDEEISFMLMPGYERKQLNYWKGLIDFSVNSSDVAIFVTNYTISNREENELLMKKIKKSFSGHSMICAITGTDIQKENTEKTKEKMQKLFELQDDQVVCTGTYTDEADNKKWKDNLFRVIGDNVVPKNDEHFKNMLRDIQTSMRLSLNNLKDIVEEKVHQEHMDNKLDYYLDEFDSKKKELRKNLQKQISNTMSDAQIQSLEKYENEKANFEKENPFKAFGNKIKRVIFSDNVNDIIKTKEDIIKALNDDDNEPLAVKAIINGFLSDTLREDRENDTLTYLLENKNPDNKKITVNKENQENLINDLKLCLDENYNTDVAEFHEGKSIMPMACELGTYYFAKKIIDSIHEQYPCIHFDEPIELMKGLEDTKKLGIGMFALAGIDILPDGKLDALVGIAETLGISTGAMVGIFATVMGVSLGITVGRDINKLSRKELEYAEEAIIDYYTAISNNILDEYDDAMEMVEKRISKNLKRQFGYGKNEMTLYNLKITLNNIDKKMVEVFREINRDNSRLRLDYVFKN